MAYTGQIDLYTQALKNEFIRAYEVNADPAPIEKAITTIGSAGRVETYPFMFPPPLFREWNGYRSFSKLGETTYRVPNKKFTAEFEVLVDDLADDQIGGFRLQAAHMARAAQLFKVIKVQQDLALGQTIKAFDDNFFFANRASGVSGAVGTGNNIFTATTAGSDGVTHAMVILVIKNGIVKPLLWQNREAPTFRNDGGSDLSDKNQMVQFWSTMRGASAFGFWWDAVLCKFANTPTVAEVQTALGTANARLRSFTYPKNRVSDPDQFIHGQTEFNAASVMVLVSNGIEHIVRQALTLSLIANSENYFMGWGQIVASGYLNNVT